VLVQLAHPHQGALGHREVGRGAVGVGLRLAEVGRLDGGERRAPLHLPPEIGQQPPHPPADRREHPRRAVLVPGQPAGGAHRPDRRRLGRCRGE